MAPVRRALRARSGRFERVNQTKTVLVFAVRARRRSHAVYARTPRGNLCERVNVRTREVFISIANHTDQSGGEDDFARRHRARR
jgi:hypothetical protein